MPVSVRRGEHWAGCTKELETGRVACKPQLRQTNDSKTEAQPQGRSPWWHHYRWHFHHHHHQIRLKAPFHPLLRLLYQGLGGGSLPLGLFLPLRSTRVVGQWVRGRKCSYEGSCGCSAGPKREAITGTSQPNPVCRLPSSTRPTPYRRPRTSLQGPGPPLPQKPPLPQSPLLHSHPHQ